MCRINKKKLLKISSKKENPETEDLKEDPE